jgi:hypothetical protein
MTTSTTTSTSTTPPPGYMPRRARSAGPMGTRGSRGRAPGSIVARP